jgi:signal peptidase II
VKRSLPLLITVACAILALDRWTKIWASTHLPYNVPQPLLGDVLRLTYTRNNGVAFGIGQNTGFPYYVFSIIAVGAILWLFMRQPEHPRGRQLAFSLILGGAIGNLIDRITRGEVVDFIEVGVNRWHWPVFNIADCAVSIGVILFALTWSSARGDKTADAGPLVAAGTHDDDAGPGSAGAEPRGAAGSLPGGGAGRPLA